MTWRKVLVYAVAVLLLLCLLPSLSIAQKDAGQTEAAAKIETELLDKFAAEGTADFIVRFAQQADLSPAYQMDWNARGEFVYNTLKATAERSQAHAKALLEANGLKYQTFIVGNELYVWAGNQATANALAALPEVAFIRATRVYQVDPPVRPAAPEATFDWGILDTQADQFWAAFGAQGDGIVVANIDTGVDYTHVALQPNYKCAANPSDPACWLDPGTQDCTGPGGGPCDTPYAGIYHGTHTMGTMAADNDSALQYTVGMAPNAQWIACLGCPYGSCPDYDLNTCADWIVAPGGNPANRPHVVNNSWGGGGCNPWYQAKVQAWRAAGVFPAFSAGNSGPSCNSLGSPGDYQESFGSASHRSDRQISDFSSRGPSCYGDDPYTKPNISAPGENIISTAPGNGWVSMSGTSMASPHSAGAVALLWSCNPSLIGQMDQTFEILQDNADTPPAGNCGAPPDGEGNYTYGYGYLNVLQAGLLWCGETGHLDGHVTDATTTAPIAGATVSAVKAGSPPIIATTDPQGYYTKTLVVGTYTVTASMYGYLPQTVTGVPVVTDTTTTQDFALTPAASYVVSGTVTDANTGWPLYASIAIDGYPGGPVWTDPVSGYYSVTLAEGIQYTFHVNAWVPGYLEESRNVGPLTGNQTEDFALDVDVAACTAPGYSPDVVYAQDFEANDGGFTTSGSNSTWQWGAPTSGPGSAHSGTNVWATNLGGNYLDYEDSYLESPNIDLSFFAGQGFTLYWWQWLQTESCCDYGEIQVSNDGGTSWATVYGPAYGNVDMSWARHGISLGPEYAVSNFRIRFHLYTDFSITYPGWYVDDIEISANCHALPGGLVVGNVYDANTGGPLDGAEVWNDSGEETVTDDGGFYTLFSPAGSHTFTATLEGYSTETAVVTVVQSDTVRQDFTLGAGYLSFTPSPLVATVDMGQSLVVSASLDNLGTFDAMFQFLERDEGFQPILLGAPIEVKLPAGPATAPAGTAVAAGPYTPAPERTYTIRPNPAPEAAPNVLLLNADDDNDYGSPIQTMLLAYGDLGAVDLYDARYGTPTLAELEAYDVVLVWSNYMFADPIGIGNVLADYVDAGGKVIDLEFAIDSSWGMQGRFVTEDYSAMEYGSTLYSSSCLGTYDPNHPIMEGVTNVCENYYRMNSTTLTPGSTAVAWWADNYLFVAVKDNRTVVTINDYVGYYYQWTGQLDLLLHNAILWLTIPGDVPWLSEEPVSGTVPAGGSLPITVTFDAGVPEVTQPGEYYATLEIDNDTPYGALEVPVTMTVTVPDTWGKLRGWVHGLGYCDDEYYPLEEAVVLIESSLGTTWTLETDEAGYYQWWLDAANSPLTVTVTYPEHETGLATGVMVTGQQTTTVDFDLRWLVPCLSVAPDSLSASLELGQSDTQQVTLTNEGAAAAGFEFREIDRGFQPGLLSLPPFTGQVPAGTTPPSTGRAPTTPRPNGEAAAPLPVTLLGEPAFAMDIYPGYNLVYIPDTTVPGSWNIIGNIPGSQYFAGDFINGDFSTLYVLDYGTNSLYAVDTATAVPTLIGPAAPGGGEAWTGMTGSLDGTMYASGSTCSSSTLYTVDLGTGAVTPIGPITNGPCIIDIAINAEGEMYGVDIVNDVLVQIDPATGAGTVIGSIGFDANYAQGMDFEEETGLLYLAAFNNGTFQGELRICDPSTGNSVSVGAFPGGAEVDCLAFATGGGGDVPWLSEDPISGTVASDGGTLVADVTFDAGAVPQPGEYYATLKVNSNDPVNGSLPVVVTMTVSAPADWGKLTGVVSGLGYCDGESYPLEEATVVARNGHVMTVTTGADGTYLVWLPGGTYTVTASAEEHLEAGAVVQVTAQQTTTQDLELRSIQPCVSLTPPAMEAVLAPGASETQILTLINEGAGPSDFKIRETTQTLQIESLPAGSSSATAPEGYVPSLNLIGSRGPHPLGGTVAIFKDANPWGSTATENILATYGIPYEVHTSAEFGSLNFDDYGMIIFSGDQPQSFYDAYAAYVSKFEDYVEGGGFLNFFSCDSGWNGGSLTAPLPGGMQWTGWVYENYNVIDDPTHPVVQGVPNPFYGNYASHGHFSNLPAEAHIIAHEQSGGQPTIVEYPLGNGWFIAFGQPLEISYDWGWDAGTILVNTLLWGHTFEPAGDVPWLSEDPVTGTIAADDTFEVEVTFTALPTMTEGTYTATLIVSTDDAQHPKINVPVTLTIVPCVEVTAVDLSLVTTGTIAPGDPVAFSADIQPNGFTPPYSYSIDYGDGGGETGSSSADPLTFGYTYTGAGTYDVEIAVWNCGMLEPVTDALTLTVQEACTDLTGITIVGPTEGGPGTYTFTTTYEPADATLPITYLWDNGDSSASSVRTLGVGTYTLTVTATNCADAMVTDSHVITVRPFYYYLPIITKNY